MRAAWVITSLVLEYYDSTLGGVNTVRLREIGSGSGSVQTGLMRLEKDLAVRDLDNLIRGSL